MTINVSRAEFERRTAELLDASQKSGDLIRVTDAGFTVFEIKPSAANAARSEAERQGDADVLERLRGNVIFYHEPLEPVGLDDWEALK